MRLLSLIGPGIVVALSILAQQAPPAEVPSDPGLYAVFDTSMGQIVARLYEDRTPATVKSFVALARGTKETLDKKGEKVQRPYFNGLTFHRVIKGFMIQGGDMAGTGSGNCGVPHLRDEIDPTLDFKEPGRLAMANAGRPNTASCQFFITVGNADYLKGMFTIFGQVVAGQEVANNISRVPTVRNDKPLVPVVIKSVTIVRKP